MSIQIQIRGGTTLEHANFRGVSREITCDTTKHTVVVQNGQTLGGFPLAREDLSNVEKLSLMDKGIASSDAENFTEIGIDNLRSIVLGNPAGTLVLAPLTELEGFFICDGAEISRTQYAKLFAKIGTTFGEGDGITTFNLPDYRGCFLRGLGGNAAADFATLQSDAIRNITGSFQATSYGTNTSGAFSLASTGNSHPWDGSGGLQRTYDFSASSVVPTASENRPINHAINYFIKY